MVKYRVNRGGSYLCKVGLEFSGKAEVLRFTGSGSMQPQMRLGASPNTWDTISSPRISAKAIGRIPLRVAL